MHFWDVTTPAAPCGPARSRAASTRPRSPRTAGPAAPTVLTGHANPVPAVAFSPDGATLATGGNDFTLRLRDTRLNAVTTRICDSRPPLHHQGPVDPALPGPRLHPALSRPMTAGQPRSRSRQPRSHELQPCGLTGAAEPPPGQGTGSGAGAEGRSQRGRGSAGAAAGPSRYTVAAPPASTSTAQPPHNHRRIGVNTPSPCALLPFEPTTAHSRPWRTVVRARSASPRGDRRTVV
ncbi:WD40 repeat domain-containing protein [Streptomyces erythrochromogenes]|uniref:WD40 repeat domain-containing protein n=1 Tax=Streptomyces erythrochromogenes TaxID=285574 RepID=UPI0036F903F4